MHEAAEQDDAKAERNSEGDTGQGRGGFAEVRMLARSQAALVRESLVRCPDAGGPAPE
jgi:hypothetical protein